MKILVIDDSKEDRDLIISYIKQIENDIKLEKIDECNCLEKGLEKLASFNYDAVILDLALPETDGIETVQTTIDHLNKHNKNTPVIVLTGSDDYSVGRQVWMLGIKEYLIKDEVESKDLSRALIFATLNSSNRSIAM